MKRLIFILILLIFLPETAIAKKRAVKAKPKKADPRPTALIGSTDLRIKQNMKADNLGIGTIYTEKQLGEMIGKELVELVDSDFYYIAQPPKKRKLKNKKQERKHIYVRPQTKSYLDLRAQEYNLSFHKRFKITSGARSIEYQNKLRNKKSGAYTAYAAQAKTPLEESLHVRGITIDISRYGMSRAEIDWMRKKLISDGTKGVEVEIENEEDALNIEPEAIEENVCYHIVVFPKPSKTKALE